MNIEEIIERLKEKNPPKKEEDVSKFIVKIPQGQILTNINIINRISM